MHSYVIYSLVWRYQFRMKYHMVIHETQVHTYHFQ